VIKMIKELTGILGAIGVFIPEPITTILGLLIVTGFVITEVL